MYIKVVNDHFYPRPPRGGRPDFPDGPVGYQAISIHALREEGDSRLPTTSGCGQNFYPRPPRGGRPTTLCFWAGCALFLSTPSARRATAGLFEVPCVVVFLSTPSARRATLELKGEGYFVYISIHALREEGDPPLRFPMPPTNNFYPRPPRGGRRFVIKPSIETDPISIHALREEGDPYRAAPSPYSWCNFYPRPPRGGRPWFPLRRPPCQK